MPSWTSAFPISELSVGDVKVHRAGKDRVAVFRLDQTDLYAIDDRCPHEGRPLAKGGVSGTVVTCAWHNFKFDLRDGRCVQGEERARVYPVRLVDGVVELDLEPPDPTSEIPAVWRSLDGGLRTQRMGRVARDVVRLLAAGVLPERIALHAAAYDARHGEYGNAHGLPVAADTLRWLPRYSGLRAAIPLVQALDVVAWSTGRLPPRPLADPAPLDAAALADPAPVEARLLALVEAEDGPAAEALLRAMLALDWPLDRLERAFLRMVAAHFLSFGHRLIYVIKAFDLLRAVDPGAAPDILPGLLHGIVTGTREDNIPRWKALRERLAGIEGELDVLYHHCIETPVPLSDAWRERIAAALLDGSESDALQMAENLWRAGVPLSEQVDALSRAAAARMMRFDPSHDRSAAVQDDWLSVTHNQTTVHALRAAIDRLREPAIVPLFFFVARFIHRNRALDLPLDARWPPPEPPEAPETPPATPADVLGAIASGDPGRALDAAAAVLSARDPAPRAALRDALHDLAVSDSATAPIVVAHVIKNVVVAWDEFDATGDPNHVLGVVKFLASRPRERWIHRQTLEAIAFVGERKLPRTLAR